MTVAAALSLAAAVIYHVVTGSHSGESELTHEGLPQNAEAPITTSAARAERPTGTMPVPSSSPAGAAHAWSEDTRRKLTILDEVLASRNDNDPRLDQSLKGLSPEAKQALREKYKSTPTEDRNARGTIAFLIGRDLQSSDDAAFLAEVLSEPPCLSLGDCSKDTRTAGGEDAHQDDGLGITLSYPQIVSLVSIERLIERNGGKVPPALRPGIERAIRIAEGSPVSAVAERARRLASKL